MNQTKFNQAQTKINAKLLRITLAICLIFTLMTGCNMSPEQQPEQQVSSGHFNIEEIPAYNGQPYIEINQNEPTFDEKDYQQPAFESYSPLDSLGRCQQAQAKISQDLMPTEDRGSIANVKPSGWHTVKYDIVPGKYLYNRCHLIGYQLTGENANEKNLITGTKYMNTEGMLPFEDMVVDYIKETGDQVLYRVTPIFTGKNLIADGVQIEASSVSDYGDSISFNVFIYNVQPGITIDYSDGSSQLDDSSVSDHTKDDQNKTIEIRGNKNSKIYHCPGQRNYEDMEDSKNLILFQSEEEAISAGYRKAKN